MRNLVQTAVLRIASDHIDFDRSSCRSLDGQLFDTQSDGKLHLITASAAKAFGYM